jgi:ribulose-5-phosphate 4-epimerase/fuculose-1-phosphate aldolase
MTASAPDELCEAAAIFYQRGYAFGSTGNLSVRTQNCVWITPTGRSLRKLRPHDLACLDVDGKPLNENRPSKEYPLHIGAYRNRSERVSAIVHLHCTHAVALSCLDELPGEDPLLAFTPYYLMRVAPLAVLPYFRPGSQELADAVAAAAAEHDCLLLRNHGVVCLGRALDEAVDRAEELEETARLFFLLRHERIRSLGANEQAEIRRVFARSRA